MFYLNFDDFNLSEIPVKHSDVISHLINLKPCIFLWSNTIVGGKIARLRLSCDSYWTITELLNYCTITITIPIVLLYCNYSYCTITQSTNLSNHWRSFYYCTTTKSNKLRTLIQNPNLYYLTVSESAKLGYYCTTLL